MKRCHQCEHYSKEYCTERHEQVEPWYCACRWVFPTIAKPRGEFFYYHNNTLYVNGVAVWTTQ